jgi:hypothetical protein
LADIQSDNFSSSPGQTPGAFHTLTMPSSATISPSKKSHNYLFIVGALIIGLCLCTGICGITFGTGIFKTITERPKVEMVIDEFIRAMADKDTVKAYALFSTRSRRNISLADIKKMLEGNNYEVFDGYRSVTVKNLNFRIGFNSNHDKLQGTVVDATGIINYDDGLTGTFNAVLEQEGGIWRLFSFNITVSPGKFNS